MKTKDSQSELEKKFITQSTFKRNSRYYNANQISNLETQYEIKRRKPLEFTARTTRQKVNASFTNSTTVLTDKLDKDIEKFRNRISVSGDLDMDENLSTSRQSSPVSPKVKSFSMEKMISRSHIDKIVNKPQSDERMFNNFKIEKHDLSRTCDFSKLKARKLELHLSHLNDIYHQEHQRIYQQYFYKRTTNNCRFNYKVENKNKKRYFFIKRRPENDPATALNPEKVDEGLKIASNFKGSNIRHDGFDAFYKGSGKDLPSQFDNRFMNELTNHYRGKNGKVIVPKLDYIVAKLKDDMETERKLKLKESKRPSFGRNEICDERFFKMNS